MKMVFGIRLGEGLENLRLLAFAAETDRFEVRTVAAIELAGDFSEKFNTLLRRNIPQV